MADEIQKQTEAEQEQEVAEKRAILQKALEAGNRPFDMERIEVAYQLAKEKHSGQFRQSGEPYIIHPLAVATIVAELGMDTESVMAALLHDVVEDTDVSLEQIEKKFGREIASLVDGLTKLGRIPYSSREEQQAENIRKMLIAMADDIRVIIIKLADRLHNMRTIRFKPPQKQRDTALESMVILITLARCRRLCSSPARRFILPKKSSQCSPTGKKIFPLYFQSRRS